MRAHKHLVQQPLDAGERPGSDFFYFLLLIINMSDSDRMYRDEQVS